MMRNSNGTWPKGYCPNPGGRPKEERLVRDKALSYTLRGIEILGEIMEDKCSKARERIIAITVILDRALGKPAQALHVTETIERKDPKYMTTAELEIARVQGYEAFIRELHKKGKLQPILDGIDGGNN